MRRLAIPFAGLLAVLGLGVLPGTTGTAQAATRDPVVFVHGYLSTASVWDTAVTAFENAGYPASRVFTFQYDFNQSNVTSAQQLQAFVGDVLRRTGAAKLDLVNHSMGGLVTRYYVKNLGGTAVVDQWASLAGANHGTQSANLCSFAASCREMTPGSAFLQQLNSGDETPGAVDYRTWFSACDGVIIPFTSTELTGATNTDAGCVAHTSFPSNQAVLGQLIGWLD
jgi:triacylglycerol lipase